MIETKGNRAIEVEEDLLYSPLRWRKYKYERGTHIVSETAGAVAAPVVTKPWRFVCESYQQPRLRLLREKYHLDDIIAGANSEFEEYVSLADWVGSIRQKSRDVGAKSSPMTDTFDALLYLKWADEGYGLHCTHCTVTFIQSCLSLGLLGRFLHMSHDTAEFWSNEYRKWVWIDPQGLTGNNERFMGAVYVRHNGVPLSALEIHKLHLANRWDEAKIRPEGMTFSEQFKNLFIRGLTAFLRNNWFSDPHPAEIDMNSPFNPYREGLRWVDEASHARIGAHNTSVEEDFNFDLNTTKVWLDYTEEWGLVNARLEGNVPNLDKFLVRIDDGQWEDKGDAFEWRLKLGANKLEAKGVNKFGRHGVVSSVAIEHNELPEQFRKRVEAVHQARD